MALLGSVERRLAASRNDDRGFSLTEVVIALTVATGIFLALGAALITSLRGTLTARQNQQSADVVNQTLESARSVSYSALSMVTSDLAGDSAIVANKFDPGTGTAETVVSGSVGSISPHVTTLTRNDTTYTMKRYVTKPAGAGSADFKRLTVVATWTVKGKTHTRRASSYFVDTRRGLPLPRFTFTNTGLSSQSAGAGTEVTWGFRVQNLGARDGWNISASSGSWTYYVDSDQDGVRDDTENTQLSDSDLDTASRRDTGLLETGWSSYVLAVGTAPTTLGSYTYSFTVESLAQPSAATARSTLNEVLTVTSNATAAPTAAPTATASASPSPTATTSSGPTIIGSTANSPSATCGSRCSFAYYYFHQSPSGQTNSDATSVLSFDGTATFQSTPYDFSKNMSGNTFGRYLARGGNTSTTSPTAYDSMLQWGYQAPNASVKASAGTAVATLWVSCGAAASSAQLTMAFGTLTGTSSTYTQLGTATSSLGTCDSAYRAVSFSIPISSASLKKNEYFVARLVMPSTSAASTVRVLYDYSGTYGSAAAQLVVPS